MNAKVYHVIIKFIDESKKECFTYVNVDESNTLKHTLEDVEKDALSQISSHNKEVVAIMAISPEEFRTCSLLPIR